MKLGPEARKMVARRRKQAAAKPAWVWALESNGDMSDEESISTIVLGALPPEQVAQALGQLVPEAGISPEDEFGVDYILEDYIDSSNLVQFLQAAGVDPQATISQAMGSAVMNISEVDGTLAEFLGQYVENPMQMIDESQLPV